MPGNGDELSILSIERLDAKLDRLVEIVTHHSSRFDAIESRLLKQGAMIEALGSKLDHTRSELLLRMDHLSLELLEAAQDEARFA